MTIKSDDEQVYKNKNRVSNSVDDDQVRGRNVVKRGGKKNGKRPSIIPSNFQPEKVKGESVTLGFSIFYRNTGFIMMTMRCDM